jgi:hypothetical protein
MKAMDTIILVIVLIFVWQIMSIISRVEHMMTDVYQMTENSRHVLDKIR